MASVSPSAQLILGTRSSKAAEEALVSPEFLGKERVTVVEIDVTNDKSIEETVALVKSKYGHLDGTYFDDDFHPKRKANNDLS